MAMGKNTFSIYAPFFTGFYSGNFDAGDKAYWDIDNDLNYYRDEMGVELDSDEDIEFDYESYQNDIAHAWCKCLQEHFPDVVQSVEFEGIWSPKYYNFETDKIEIKVQLADDWKTVMTKFMKDNYDWLQGVIHNDWTSRDGFMSFMDNDIEAWWSDLFAEEDSRYVECMLTYMMCRENEHIQDDIIDEVMNMGDLDIYTRLTESGREKVAEIEEKKRIKLLNEKYQLKIPFEN